MALDKEFLKNKKHKLTKHHIDEWNDYIYVRPLTGSEWATLGKKYGIGSGKALSDSDGIALMMDMVKYCWVNEKGERVISDEETELLDKVELSILQRISEYAGEASIVTQKSAEELKKN